MIFFQTLHLLYMEKQKKAYKNKKFKISALTWIDKFELSDGLYSVSNIQDCFKYIITKFETVTDNSPITKYGNKIENKLHLKLRQDDILSF